MKMEKNTVITLNTNTSTGAYFVYNESGDIAILIDDGYRCTIYNCSFNQIKDIARFLEWDPNYPDSYLSRKYGIEDPDIFGGVMRYREWFDVLYELGVIDSNVEVAFDVDLDEAFRDMFHTV